MADAANERRPSQKRRVTKLYEADDYVAVDKPCDMCIDKQRNREGDDPNLEDLVRAAVAPALRGEVRHCHQLDYATSGVMLYATSRKAAAAAQKCFQGRTARKAYLALVWGAPRDATSACELAVIQDPDDAFRMKLGDLETVWPLLAPGAAKEARHERRKRRKHSGPAFTTVEVVARGTYLGRPVAKLLLRPKTGRRHQLRLHCVALGLPIVGDATYGPEDDDAPRMMLHARTLMLPVGERGLEVSAPDPFRVGLLAGLWLDGDDTPPAPARAATAHGAEPWPRAAAWWGALRDLAGSRRSAG